MGWCNSMGIDMHLEDWVLLLSFRLLFQYVLSIPLTAPLVCSQKGQSHSPSGEALCCLSLCCYAACRHEEDYIPGEGKCIQHVPFLFASRQIFLNWEMVMNSNCARHLLGKILRGADVVSVSLYVASLVSM